MDARSFRAFCKCLAPPSPFALAPSPHTEEHFYASVNITGRSRSLETRIIVPLDGNDVGGGPAAAANIKKKVKREPAFQKGFMVEAIPETLI